MNHTTRNWGQPLNSVHMRTIHDSHRELILMGSHMSEYMKTLWYIATWKYSVKTCIWKPHVLLKKKKDSICFLLPFSASRRLFHIWEYVEDFPSRKKEYLLRPMPIKSVWPGFCLINITFVFSLSDPILWDYLDKRKQRPDPIFWPNLLPMS